MSRETFVWDSARQDLVPAAEFYARKYADVAASELAAPMVLKDQEPYRSMVDGSMITGRRQHRDHLKAHGCVELGNDLPKPRATGPSTAEIRAELKRAAEVGPTPGMAQALERAHAAADIPIARNG